MIDVNKAMAFIHVTPTVYQHPIVYGDFFHSSKITENKNERKKQQQQKSDLVPGPNDAHSSEQSRCCLQQWQVTCRQQSIS